jgi:hypothetical protein
MAIIKTVPVRKFINGQQIETSEITLVSELDYRTNGEDCCIVRGVPESFVTLDSRTSDHITVKAMTRLTVRPDIGKIDEEYDEIVADKFACIEFRFVGGHWYILSSDGLKQS